MGSLRTHCSDREGAAFVASEDLAQEELGAIVLGVREEVLRGSLFDDRPVVEEHDTIRHLTCKAHLVRDHHHGHTTESELLHDVEHLYDDLVVERGS